MKERMIYIEERLVELTQDIIQSICGEIVPDIEGRKAEFVSLHNELREMLGKEPRQTQRGEE